MIELIPMLETLGQLLLVLSGIWFIRSKQGIPAVIFLTGATLNFIGLSVVMLFEIPFIEFSPEVPLGINEYIVFGLPAIGFLLLGIGGACLGYNLQALNK